MLLFGYLYGIKSERRLEEDVSLNLAYRWFCGIDGIVSRETGVADGSFLPSNVSWDSRYEAVETIQQSTVKYMEELEVELSSKPGYKEPENVKKEKESLKSRTEFEGHAS